jgi:high-affinity Fe2+/Pb2+ permease
MLTTIIIYQALTKDANRVVSILSIAIIALLILLVLNIYKVQKLKSKLKALDKK